MFARYTGYKVCPVNAIPIRIQYTSDQLIEPRDLVLQTKKSDKIPLDRCKTCSDTSNVWSNSITCEPLEQDELICPVDCNTVYSEIPKPTCNFNGLKD